MNKTRQEIEMASPVKRVQKITRKLLSGHGATRWNIAREVQARRRINAMYGHKSRLSGAKSGLPPTQTAHKKYFQLMNPSPWELEW